jgi:hypothetical protein
MKLSRSVIIGIAVIILIASIAFIKYPQNHHKPISECVELCKKALEEGKDLSNGPCLSDNNPEWKFTNWVCDVAHWPRESVDDMRENQCNEWWKAYEEGRKINFVEVDPNCNFIRTG